MYLDIKFRLNCFLRFHETFQGKKFLAFKSFFALFWLPQQTCLCTGKNILHFLVLDIADILLTYC